MGCLEILEEGEERTVPKGQERLKKQLLILG